MFTAIRTSLRRARERKQRGQTLVIFAGGLVMLLGLVGLALDAGRAYVVSTQLSKAVDAAVLAGARASGTDNEVKAVMERTMRINFPKDYMGVNEWPRPIRLEITPNYTDPQTNFITKKLDVAATVILPTTFLRVLGFKAVPITKSATAVRLILDIIVVADRSTSIGPTAFAKFKEAIKGFITNFDEREDRVGMLVFAGNITWLSDPPLRDWPGFDKSQIIAELDRVNPPENPDRDLEAWTASGPALEEAYQALLRNPFSSAPNQANRWKVILFFTDGTPNTIHIDPTYYAFRPCQDGRGSWCGQDEDCSRLGEPGPLQSAHLSAGDETHPDPFNREYIVGLYKHLNKRVQDLEWYVSRGFDKRESWIVADQAPISNSCADPRHLIGNGRDLPLPDPAQPENLRRPVQDGRVVLLPQDRGIPDRDAFKGPFTDGRLGIPFGAYTTPNGTIVSVRPQATEPLLPGNSNKRWRAFRRQINAAARNNLENIAHLIRQPRFDVRGFEKGVTIFTIGYNGSDGAMLTESPEWSALETGRGETGLNICQRVSNVPEAGDYFNRDQPQGFFVRADNDRELQEAFIKVANAILRLTN